MWPDVPDPRGVDSPTPLSACSVVSRVCSRCLCHPRTHRTWLGECEWAEEGGDDEARVDHGRRELREYCRCSGESVLGITLHPRALTLARSTSTLSSSSPVTRHRLALCCLRWTRRSTYRRRHSQTRRNTSPTSQQPRPDSSTSPSPPSTRPPCPSRLTRSQRARRAMEHSQWGSMPSCRSVSRPLVVARRNFERGRASGAA